jgi:hypothetical protein
MRSTLLSAILLAAIVMLPGGATAQSLDLAVGDYGLSFGNSKRFTGIRVNVVDRDVERVNGLNITLWTPGPSPEAQFNGFALALIGTKAREIKGIALSGIGVNARESIRGGAAGLFGVAAGDATGIVAGLFTTNVRSRVRGVEVAGIWTSPTERIEGLAASAGSVLADHVRGVSVGLFSTARESQFGLAFGVGGFFARRMDGLGVGGFGGGGEKLRGIFVGGLGLGAKDLDGLALSLGGIGGESLDGIMVSGLGLGATGEIRGVALSGLVNFSPKVTGISLGLLNGFYPDRIDLEDFLHFDFTNREYTGLQVGLFNYSAQLHGVQLGLINYAANNPRWARLLPLINVHFP